MAGRQPGVYIFLFAPRSPRSVGEKMITSLSKIRKREGKIGKRERKRMKKEKRERKEIGKKGKEYHIFSSCECI